MCEVGAGVEILRKLHDEIPEQEATLRERYEEFGPDDVWLRTGQIVGDFSKCEECYAVRNCGCFSWCPALIRAIQRRQISLEESIPVAAVAFTPVPGEEVLGGMETPAAPLPGVPFTPPSAPLPNTGTESPTIPVAGAPSTSPVQSLPHTGTIPPVPERQDALRGGGMLNHDTVPGNDELFATQTQVVAGPRPQQNNNRARCRNRGGRPGFRHVCPGCN